LSRVCTVSERSPSRPGAPATCPPPPPRHQIHRPNLHRPPAPEDRRRRQRQTQRSDLQRDQTPAPNARSGAAPARAGITPPVPVGTSPSRLRPHAKGGRPGPWMPGLPPSLSRSPEGCKWAECCPSGVPKQGVLESRVPASMSPGGGRGGPSRYPTGREPSRQVEPATSQ
jgi:hypothetical protein